MKVTKLAPLQSEVINLFNRYPRTPLNTFYFRREGITSPSQVIATLKAKGAVIHVTYQEAFDESGKLHKRVAHYTFNGGL